MQRRVAEAQALHEPAPVILGDDVGALQQSPQDALAIVMFQVDRDAALVAVHHQKGGGLIADLRRHHVARVVAAWNFFELDDVRAHVGEHQPAGGPRHDVAQLDDLETGERPGHHTLPWRGRVASEASGVG